MRIIQLFKPGLFIYELLKFMILVFILLFQKEEPVTTAKMIFAASGVLFPLMALFIWLDTNRYNVYLPLLIAGKCVGIFILLGWSILSKQVTMIESYLLSGDLFALAVILLIIKDAQKPIETQDSMEEI